MAKAKATPVKEEKLITLTQEQFNTLIQIQDAINTEISDLKDAVADTDLEPIELGFNIGSVHASLYEVCNQLEIIINSINPLDYEISWDDEDEN